MTVTEHYRNLHRIPELAGNEFETAAYIEAELAKLGYAPVRVAGRGVYADLIAHPAAKWLLFRADTDALAVEERSAAPVCSGHPGVMHACGHDSHCAMLLSAAEALRGAKLSHNIRFLFQPSEETTEGAAEVIAAGAVPEGICAAFAMHVWPDIEKGKTASRPGVMMASSDIFRIRLRGKSAHCARAAEGADALRTAVDIAAALPGIRESAQDPRTVLFLGSLHGGKSHNVVCETAELFGTLRTFSGEDREALKARLSLAAEQAADRHKTEAEILWDMGCPMVQNDERLISALQSQGVEILTTEATLAGEDFSRYGAFAPALLLWLGIGAVPPLHSPGFYVPEDALPAGVELWQRIARTDWSWLYA